MIDQQKCQRGHDKIIEKQSIHMQQSGSMDHLDYL